MYNEASTSRESKKQDTNTISTPRPAYDDQLNNEDNEDDNDNSSTHSARSLMSTSTIYTAELEAVIRTEQLNRVGLIKQITSEREQVGSVAVS